MVCGKENYITLVSKTWFGLKSFKKRKRSDVKFEVILKTSYFTYLSITKSRENVNGEWIWIIIAISPRV